MFCIEICFFVSVKQIEIIFEYFIEGHNWGYRTEREKSACMYLEGGVCYWPKGRALGGTSVVNYMVRSNWK